MPLKRKGLEMCFSAFSSAAGRLHTLYARHLPFAVTEAGIDFSSFLSVDLYLLLPLRPTYPC